MPKPTIQTHDSLYITDHTDETKYMQNNTPNYPGIAELLRGPVSIIERNAMADPFSPEFEGTPDDTTLIDMKILTKIIGRTMMDIEALIKCYSRHGKNNIVEGDTTVERYDKATGKLEKTMRITALEQLVQSSIIGTWMEMVTTLRHGGDEAKKDVLGNIAGEEFKTTEEMYQWINSVKKSEQTLENFRDKLNNQEWLMDIFPKPSQLAKAVYEHQQKEMNFYTAVKNTKYFKELAEVDQDILMAKIRDNFDNVLDAINDLPLD